MLCFAGEKPFKCEFCVKEFSAKINLDSHLLRQHNVNTGSAHPCRKCSIVIYILK